MIQTWRQCYTSAHFTAGKTVAEFFTVGPFRAGGFISELRLTIAVGAYTHVDMGAVVVGTDSATEEQFAVGSPIIQRSNHKDIGNQPTLRRTVHHYTGYYAFIPLWRRVDAGAAYVLVGVKPLSAYTISVLASVTVVGVARVSANGWGVEDGLDQ